MSERRRTSRAEDQTPTKRPPPPSASVSTAPSGRARNARATSAPPASGVVEHKTPAQFQPHGQGGEPRTGVRARDAALQEPHAPKQTLSVAIVALGDIPTLLGEMPGHPGARDDASPSLAPLLLAIDGDLTVAEIADRLRIEPEQARAMIAELVDRGVVALSRKPASSSGVGAVRSSTPRSLDYWLAGLKPRTK